MQEPQKFEVQDKFLTVALREQVAELTSTNGVLKGAVYQLQEQVQQQQTMISDLEKARADGAIVGAEANA